MSGWNPRFALYARAQGRKPQAQLDHDREEYPGGCMAGFILWMGPFFRRFATECPEHYVGNAIHDHAAFDRWLEDHV